MNENIVYCIDTSSFIEMKNKYPKNIFPSVWNNMEKLYKNDRLIFPIEVLKEIEKGDDELTTWIKEEGKKGIFMPDEEQTERVKEIFEKYPFLAKHDKSAPNADPWLIALAIKKNEEGEMKLFRERCIVVTEESKTHNERIPRVCKDYNIECINLIELFNREGWKF